MLIVREGISFSRLVVCMDEEREVEEYRGHKLKLVYTSNDTRPGPSYDVWSDYPDLEIDGNRVRRPELPSKDPSSYLRELVDDVERIHEIYSGDHESRTREELKDELVHGEEAVQFALYDECFLRYDWDDLVLELRG